MYVRRRRGAVFRNNIIPESQHGRPNLISRRDAVPSFWQANKFFIVSSWTSISSARSIKRTNRHRPHGGRRGNLASDRRRYRSWWSSRMRQIVRLLCVSSTSGHHYSLVRCSHCYKNKFSVFFLRRRINKISSLRLLRTNVARLDWTTVCFGINKWVAEQTSIRFGEAHQRRASAALLERQTIVFDEANGRLLCAPQN